MPRDAHLCQDSFSPLFTLRRDALSFSPATFVPPEVPLRSAPVGEGTTSSPVLATRVRQRSDRPREFHEIQKKTTNPFSRAPHYLSISPEWVTAVSSSGFIRERSVIRSQVKILTTIINAVRIGERLVIDRSPRIFHRNAVSVSLAKFFSLLFFFFNFYNYRFTRAV